MCQRQLGGGGWRGSERGEGVSGGNDRREMCVRAGVYERYSFTINQDIEPTTPQMTCRPKVNKMVKCVVLRQSLFTRC